MSVTPQKLAAYVARRDFSKTAEPPAKAARKNSGPLLFVVQKHDATRLHFDFRLEWEGVLLSWAVTKGPSADPSTKRLAVRTEDHPLDYGDFEGTIPKDQYGGGTVMLWDHGSWDPVGDVGKGLKEGKLKFTLTGERMKGHWTLVRMGRKEGEKRENWLLIKEKDAFQEPAEDGLIRRYTKSIKSFRSMTEIAADKPGRKQDKALQNKRRERARHDLKRPRFSEPQLAKRVDDVPEGDDWLHETKFDGYRCLAALGKGGVRLYTRSGKDWTERYEGLPEAFEALDCRSALIDGEVVADGKGKGSAFSALQQAMDGGVPVYFMAFDLLQLNGRTLTSKPLEERKDALRQLLAGQPKRSPIRFSEHVRGNGRKVFEAVAKAGGEGIVSKAADSAYTGRRDGKWLKIKSGHRQEFIIGGWSPSTRKTRPFSSLLVGVKDGGQFVYRGRVGSGFDEADFESLVPQLKTRARKTSPFVEVPTDVARTAKWVTPDLVAEIEYAELTDQGSVRHGVFKGLRGDKDADEVVMETERSQTEEGEDPRFLGVSVSSADRIVFPDTKTSKGDLAAYYAEAAERMLALAGNRPISLLRCPSGIEGECFFQKHAGKGFPEQIETVEIAEKTGDEEPYMVIRDPAGLVAAAQMGTVEFHIWGSRTDNLEKPDRLVFDLDPDEGLDFRDVKAAAREVRDLLKELGLESVPMVTGGKGIHVFCHLRRTAGWETVNLFARTLATYLAQKKPKRYVATMSKARRKGRIFIDWLRNERGSTAIAPFSVRARAGAPVAVPVTWTELSRLKSANSFSIAKARRRLAEPSSLEKADADQSINADVIARLEKLTGA
ncbi:DNA ligase D [Rhodobacterales bacterium]|nr:DNA ligase D [Rhodobacterales bacterium]